MSLVTYNGLILPAVIMMFQNYNSKITDWRKTGTELLFSYSVGANGDSIFFILSILTSFIVTFWIENRTKLLLGWIVLSLLICCGERYSVRPKLILFIILLCETLPFFSRLWFPYRMLAYTQLVLSLSWIVFLRSKHVKFVWIVLGAQLFQLYDYCLIPVVQTSLYDGQAYQKEDIDAPILEMPIGFAKQTIASNSSSATCFWWYGRKYIDVATRGTSKSLSQNPYNKLRSLKGLKRMRKDIQ